MTALALGGRRRSVENELQELQIEPLAELVTDLWHVRDFDESEVLVKSQADYILRGDAGHHDVKIV